jgi:hypothetical protein
VVLRAGISDRGRVGAGSAGGGIVTGS